MSERDEFYDAIEALAVKLVGPRGKHPNMPISIERDNRGKFGSLTIRVKGEAATSATPENVTRKVYEIGGGAKDVG